MGKYRTFLVKAIRGPTGSGHAKAITSCRFRMRPDCLANVRDVNVGRQDRSHYGATAAAPTSLTSPVGTVQILGGAAAVRQPE